MFETIGLLAAGAASVGGFLQSRKFVRDRLKYVDAVQRSATPWVAGAAAFAVATPVVWVLPLVGGGTALLFGVGVGAGVASGARALRRRLPSGY